MTDHRTCSAPGCDELATWSVAAVGSWIRVAALPVCDVHRDALLIRAADAPDLDLSVTPW